MTQFSRGLRRSRTDIGAEDGTPTSEGATRTVQRDVVILIARELQSLKGRGTGHPHSQGATVLEATVLEGEENAPTSTQNVRPT